MAVRLRLSNRMLPPEPLPDPLPEMELEDMTEREPD